MEKIPSDNHIRKILDPVPTIQRMEGSEAVIRGSVDSLMKLITALDVAGIELIAEGPATLAGEAFG